MAIGRFMTTGLYQTHVDSRSLRFAAPTVLAVLWLGLWASINTGPGRINHAQNLVGLLHGLRAYLPFCVALGAGMFWLSATRRARFATAGPLGLLVAYASVGVCASLLSLEPLVSLYWGVAYLSAFPVLALAACSEGRDVHLGRLMELNWLVVLAMALAVLAIGRGSLFSGAMVQHAHLRGYSLSHGMEYVGGMPMVRASGAARLFAVVAIIAFVRMWSRPGATRWLWAAPAVLVGGLVLLMHSRGAVFGLAAAVGLVVVLRRSHVLLLLAPAVLFALVLVGPDAVEGYVRRGQSDAQLYTLTGRLNTWREGWSIFLGSPVVGLGFNADRLYVQNATSHMHNSLLHSLIQSGAVGGAAFVGAWLSVWGLFVRAWRRRQRLSVEQRRRLLEAGAVLAFFTVRAIPESTAAYFGVDLILVLPVFAYVQALAGQQSRVPLAAVREQEGELFAGLTRKQPPNGPQSKEKRTWRPRRGSLSPGPADLSGVT